MTSVPALPTSGPAAPASATCRYGVYLIPSGPWARLGQRWLGRNAASGARILRPLSEDAAVIDAWTEAPRLYGLHATLKPPFRLARGQTVHALDDALRQLAATMSPFDLPLQLTRVRGFLAWGVAGPTPPALERLANACVADLDRFRAPPSDAEMARRLAADLTLAQQANLRRWGYPYVFDTFTFHMTLTGRLDEFAIAAAEAALARMALPDEAAALLAGSVMPVADVGLFVQREAGAPFVIARRYGFDGRTQDAVGIAALEETERTVR